MTPYVPNSVVCTFVLATVVYSSSSQFGKNIYYVLFPPANIYFGFDVVTRATARYSFRFLFPFAFRFLLSFAFRLLLSFAFHFHLLSLVFFGARCGRPQQARCGNSCRLASVARA